MGHVLVCIEGVTVRHPDGKALLGLGRVGTARFNVALGREPDVVVKELAKLHDHQGVALAANVCAEVEGGADAPRVGVRDRHQPEGKAAEVGVAAHRDFFVVLFVQVPGSVF